MKKTSILSIAACLLALVSASCEKEEIKPEQKGDGTVVLNCVKPAYLMPGDTVALISPSYFTPMENVNKTADLLRSWGLVLPSQSMSVTTVPRSGSTLTESSIRSTPQLSLLRRRHPLQYG